MPLPAGFHLQHVPAYLTLIQILPAAVLIARLFVSGVFAVSGLAKLADRAGTTRSLVAFGVPTTIAGALAMVLIAAELATAVALLPVATMPYGAAAALALLTIFCIGIAANLARGRTPDCNCFGQLHSEPIGWPTLGRNVILAVVAAFVALNSRDPHTLSLLPWFGHATAAEQALFALGLIGLLLIAGLGLLLVQVLQQQGRLLLRFESLETQLGMGASHNDAVPTVGLPPQSPAPDFELRDFDGEPAGLKALLGRGKDLFLLFTNPNCGPCQELLPEVTRWQNDYAESLTVALVTEGSKEDNQEKIAAHGLKHLLLQEKREVADAFQAYGTPSAVAVAANGTIASYVAGGADAIRNLLNAALDGRLGPRPSSLPGIGIGEPAPALRLNDIDGKTISISDLQGARTALLFWNPDCGYCQKMLPDLRSWEANPPSHAPRVIVVSSGSESANRALQLRSRVAIDANLQIGSAFGAHGTPMAILIDAEGKVASPVAAGQEAVFALLAKGQSASAV